MVKPPRCSLFQTAKKLVVAALVACGIGAVAMPAKAQDFTDVIAFTNVATMTPPGNDGQPQTPPPANANENNGDVVPYFLGMLGLFGAVAAGTLVEESRKRRRPPATPPATPPQAPKQT